MRLPVAQLKEGENPFHFQTERDGWLKDLGTHLAARGNRLTRPLDVSVALTRLEPDYYLKGTLRCAVELECARCAEHFPLDIDHPFELALVHSKAKPARATALSDESEELDVTFFEGPDLDLAPLLQEQFVLSLPYQALCRPECRGICQKCRKNLNQEACGCSQGNPISPFACLQELRP